MMELDDWITVGAAYRWYAEVAEHPVGYEAFCRLVRTGKIPFRQVAKAKNRLVSRVGLADYLAATKPSGGHRVRLRKPPFASAVDLLWAADTTRRFLR